MDQAGRLVEGPGASRDDDRADPANARRRPWTPLSVAVFAVDTSSMIAAVCFRVEAAPTTP